MCRKEINYLKMSTKEREQLNAEISILGSLRHPNIVAYYHRDHLKSSSELHMYMEYCGGGDLADYIKNLKSAGRKAPEEFVWMIFSQLVTALYRCHYGKDAPPVGSNVMAPTPAEEGGLRRKTEVMILHRDLKPDNIFIGEDDTVKLGDFGLSKLMHCHDYASTYVGTPYYMSPEICAAEKYTLQSDIWSLGCIMYELCTTKPPFDAKSHFELITKIKAGRFEPIGPTYSPELASVISSCLKTNARLRPVTKQLIHMPVVRMMRKEREMVEVGSRMHAKEQEMNQKIAEAQALLESLNKEIERKKAEMRLEVEASVRREWEVKAQLEINRLVAEKVQQEVQRLRGLFDTEVGNRVEVRVAERLREIQATVVEPLSANTSQQSAPSPTTDLTSLSFNSPMNASTRKPKKPQLSTRTPFARARTQIDAPSPVDVDMASPSPAPHHSIASLGLSPRRAAAMARGLPAGNIFKDGQPEAAPPPPPPLAWQPQGASSPGPAVDSDDEDADELPPLPSGPDLSPTRPPRHAARNPFLGAAPPTRPGLTRQVTAPAARPPAAGPRPSLFTRGERTGPAAAAGGDDMLKAVTQRNLRGAHGGAAAAGRTLVELQQARAAGPGLARRGSYGEAPTWDPEDADAPSPFLKRTRASLAP